MGWDGRARDDRCAGSLTFQVADESTAGVVSYPRPALALFGPRRLPRGLWRYGLEIVGERRGGASVVLRFVHGLVHVVDLDDCATELHRRDLGGFNDLVQSRRWGLCTVEPFDIELVAHVA